MYTRRVKNYSINLSLLVTCIIVASLTDCDAGIIKEHVQQNETSTTAVLPLTNHSTETDIFKNLLNASDIEINKSIDDDIETSTHSSNVGWSEDKTIVRNRLLFLFYFCFLIYSYNYNFTLQV